MNDLISKSQAKQEILSWAVRIGAPQNLSTEDTMFVIDNLPTVDAEVVRCRDCMHYNHAVIDDDPAETFEVDVCLHKDLFPTRVTPDFYCAHGERKMGAEVHDG